MRINRRGVSVRVLFACVLAFSVAWSLAVLADDGDAENENDLCPQGYNESFNAGFDLSDVGCTLCERAEDCNAACKGPGTCFCSPGPGFESCCEDNPCCDGCPEPKPLKCSFLTCGCSPAECCYTICPKAAAPTATPYGLAALGVLLAGLGLYRVRRRLAG